MMQIKEIEAIKLLLATPKKITIIPHRNPDGDAMGSTLGLYHTLKQLQHEVVVMAPNEFPEFLSWLPESEKVIIFERSFDTCKAILEKTELLFTLDFNALHRTGEQMENVLKTVKASSIMIDHHQAPDGYATFTFSDTAYGSTCEMVYDFVHQLGFENLINKTVATCLYTGIVTDSGSFRFPKTTSKTHKCVADLIDKGINNSEIHNLLFDNSSYNRLLLLGKALQNLKMLPEYKTTYITLSQDELNEFGHQKGDTEGIVNYGLSIKGIDFTAIFIENKEEGIIKISFRSQGDFDVNQFARNHFNGGGHINAAGGKSFSSLQETVQQFIAILAQEKKITKMKIQNLFLFGALILLASCSQQQQARKPISHTSGTFIKESIERNKILIADEEDLIAEVIKKDSLKSYIASSKGYWYKYETKIEAVSPTPKRGDIAFFDYEIKDLKNRIIYTMTETKPQVYYVDKENIMMGLRDGIKLMKKGETVTFLFPSHMAYGYHGDDKKIGTNEPLICTVSLNDIKLDTQAKN